MSDEQEQRLQKAAALRERGIDPYGGRFERTLSFHAIQENYREHPLIPAPVHAVAGRMIALRRFGKAAFAHLQDISGRLQVYFKRDTLGPEGFDLFEHLDVGDHIGAEGILFRTKTQELTLAVQHLTLLAKALRPLPEKWHGLTDIALRYRMRYVDLIVNPEVRAVFIQRSRIIDTLRRLLQTHQFLEVETPMMHPIAGGAAARPFITHHNAMGRDLYLRIAPELYLKRLMVGGLERVFEINRNFRNEGVSTVHHPEFTMLEFYMAYANYVDMMSLTETLISEVAQQVLGHMQWEDQGRRIDLTPPWQRISYLAAIAQHYQVDPSDLSDAEKVSKILAHAGLSPPRDQALYQQVNLLFEAGVEPQLSGPVFVCDYPTAISPLAKRQPGHLELTERFELYIAGREIANGFSELNDPVDQRERFEAQAKKHALGDLECHAVDEDYLCALEYGMPPAAGCGIGIDRLVMLLSGQASIRDVILFPQMKPVSGAPADAEAEI